MTVTLELNPEEFAALSARAHADGVDVETVLHGLVAQIAPAPARQIQEPLALTEGQKTVIALMQSRSEENQTDTPEELAERDRELAEFKANINRWRADEGRPTAF